jgi:hypothetical protein
MLDTFKKCIKGNIKKVYAGFRKLYPLMVHNSAMTINKKI